MCGMRERFSMLCFLEIIRVRGLPPVAVRGSCSVSEEEMVGTTGFEPATSRTPSVRATRLRYVPTGTLTTMRREKPEGRIAVAPASTRLSPPFEQRQESTERIAQIQQHLAAQKLRGPFRRRIEASALRFNSAIVLAEMPPRAGDGESFVVEQTLDAEDHVHVILAVE